MVRPVDVAVIVRHWNAGAMVDRCVSDFLSANSHSGLSFQFIVCSDGSFDNSESRIQRRSNLRLLVLPHRQEYCAALNRAADVAEKEFQPRYLLFLNADLWEFSPGFADALVHSLQRECVAWVTPEIFDSEGKNLSVLRARKRLGLDYPLSTECHLIRSDVFKEFGGFDETLVRYYEDVDLYTRLIAAGHSCCLTRDASVKHLGSGLSSRQVFVRVYFGVRNPIVIWRRYRPQTDLTSCARTIFAHCRPSVIGRARPLWIAGVLWIAAVFLGVISGAWRAILWRGETIKAAEMRRFARRRSYLLLLDRPLEVWAKRVEEELIV